MWGLSARIHGHVDAPELALIAAAGERGAALRLLGGRAVRWLCAGRVPEGLLRPPGDLDFFARSHDRRTVTEVFADHGYAPEREFNLLNGKSRLIFTRDGLKVDVFLDEFRMCHRLDLRNRLQIGNVTLSLADLLLTKLQVVQFTEKDRLDASALLYRAETGPGPTGLDAAYVAGLCARDWGLWRTVTRNLENVRGALPAAGELTAAIAATPKTTAWRLRAAIGERLPWYELPEEP